MSTKQQPKFSKETHKFRNGPEIDFIGYYPGNTLFPYLIVAKTGSTFRARENGMVDSVHETVYDLVPIKKP